MLELILFAISIYFSATVFMLHVIRQEIRAAIAAHPQAAQAKGGSDE